MQHRDKIRCRLGGVGEHTRTHTEDSEKSAEFITNRPLQSIRAVALVLKVCASHYRYHYIAILVVALALALLAIAVVTSCAIRSSGSATTMN